MKIALLFLAGLCALGLAVPSVKTVEHHQVKVADKDWLKKEYEILRLFKHVHQESYYKDFVDIAHTWHFEEHYDAYTKPEVVKHFWYLHQHDHFPRGEIFSVFHEDHLKHAIALFKVLYYAKDWDTFYKSAVWARHHVNEGVYVYALSVAIVHRPDTHGIILPPIYEIYPYYFFPTEVIHQAQKYKQQWNGVYEHVESTGYNGYTIHANYSGWYLNLHPEQSMSYYTEDVGINSFYYYYNLYYPFWMDSQEFNIKNYHRGEQYYYVHQQLLARYYLERLSNDFGEIPYFDWDYPIDTGYYPSLHYHNGLEFPIRPPHSEVHHKHHDGYQSHSYYRYNYTWAYTYVKDYERRIRDAIDQGFVYTHDGQKVNLYDEHGFETLGNLIESNPESPNTWFYGHLQIFARYLLGYSYYPLHKYHVAPSALEHFETSLRDPVFYQFYKRLVHYFYHYKSHLQPYKHEELHFPGVSVDHVHVDNVVTYFEKYYSDISHAVYVNEKEFQDDSFHVRVEQDRLNYKPFTFKVHVTSEKPVDAIVRVFIGPKYDEYGREFNISHNYQNFVEFDRFTYKLVAGKNVISRSSHDNWYAKDHYTYPELFHHVSNALEGKEEFHYYDHDAYYGFPSRYLVPKGHKSGQVYQFYFHVSPYVPAKVEGQNEWYYPVGFEHQYVDQYAYGYPFDRPIHHEHHFHVPNGHFHDVYVYHKDVSEINATH